MNKREKTSQQTHDRKNGNQEEPFENFYLSNETNEKKKVTIKTCSCNEKSQVLASSDI